MQIEKERHPAKQRLITSLNFNYGGALMSPIRLISRTGAYFPQQE